MKITFAEFLILVTFIKYLIFFFKLVIKVYDAIEREVRIVLRNERVNKKKFHSLFLTVDYTNSTSFIFLLSLLYPWLRKCLRNFTHKRGNQIQHLIFTLVLKQLRTCATQISSIAIFSSFKSETTVNLVRKKCFYLIKINLDV